MSAGLIHAHQTCASVCSVTARNYWYINNCSVMGKCGDWTHVPGDREAQMRKILLSLVQLEESRVATTNTLAKQIKHCEEAVVWQR